MANKEVKEMVVAQATTEEKVIAKGSETAETKKEVVVEEETRIIGADIPSKEKIDALIKDGDVESIRPVIVEIVQAQNEWLLKKDYTSAVAWDETLNNLIGRYTNVKRNECFAACRETGNAMLEACRLETFQTIRVKETEDKETGIKTRKIVGTDKDIDLLLLHANTNGGIGVDKEWLYKMQKLNYLLAIKAGQAIGDPKWAPENLKNISDSFNMNDIARAFDMGKNPCSNTQMLKTLTTIIQSMIGTDYKPTSHDVAALAEMYSKKDKKARSIQLPNHKTFCLMMRDVCHNCICKDGYSANSKEVKTKK